MQILNGFQILDRLECQLRGRLQKGLSSFTYFTFISTNVILYMSLLEVLWKTIPLLLELDLLIQYEFLLILTVSSKDRLRYLD